jgi:hypothetical protein
MHRGIDRRVTYKALLGFARFTAVDVGGTVGTLAMSASGLAGAVGFNALQCLVLKGIVITSGYWPATTAVLGLGMGGMMLRVAGAAGPIGTALVLLYTAYFLAGPAFRKLIPVICVIAAKRVELGSRVPLSAAERPVAPGSPCPARESPNCPPSSTT